ncbi:hypothetical protein E4U21_004598, partial [Claviceps maximensis]
MYPVRCLLLTAWAVRIVSAAGDSRIPSFNWNVPKLPSQDEFYLVPADIQQAAPGSILRHRTTPNPIGIAGAALQLQLEASHQILYRTTDSLGEATATVLTVLIPRGADLSRVLSYQVAEDAASINCAPSYAFQINNKGTAQGNELTESELMGPIRDALGRGWVVVAPDFEGPRAAFLAGALSAHAILDGIRAAVNSGNSRTRKSMPMISL